MGNKSLTIFGVITLLVSGCADEEDKVTFFSLLPPSELEILPPSNVPPDDFDGEFWVDQNGCSYIRTGRGNWVPRMNLDRTRMCDPSLQKSANKVASELASPTVSAIDTVSIDPDTGKVSEIRPELVIAPTYVQVGAYSDREAGIAVREKFANLGFPIVGKNLSPPQGRTLTVVLGPYTDSGFLEDALDTAKALGHNDAYVYQNR